MLNDQILQLAFSVYNNPGVYALLLGSGVSRSAGIPTGLGVVNDLICQVAVAQDETISQDPYEWFKQKYGQVPRYDALLEELGRKQFERNAMLRHWFEPTEEEREKGIKLPTPAHHAIARLIKQGYIRVILTTNFDHLLENALDEVGVTPNVVTQEDLPKMIPLRHADHTIIKLHGDYLDGHFKNTPSELAEYTDEMNRQLADILEEYGLVVCGWSGDLDTALRNAMEQVKRRCYSMFWISYTELEETAQSLTALCNAQVISNISADNFFTTLEGQIDALQKFARNKPISVAVAVQQTKRLIPYAEKHLELEDFFRFEVERAYEAFTQDTFRQQRNEIVNTTTGQKRFEDVWELYYEVIEIPLHMAAVMAWYGKEDISRLFTKAIERWTEYDFNEGKDKFRFFPSLSFIYVVGIAAVCNENWEQLPSILQHPRTMSFSQLRELVVTKVIGDVIIKEFVSDEGYRYPSTSLCSLLRRIFKELIPSDQHFGHAFDIFDMLWGLVYLDQNSNTSDNWHPGLSLISEERSYKYLERFWEQAAKQGKDFPILKTGLFDGQTEKVQEALRRFVQFFVQRMQLDNFPDYSQIYEDNRRPSAGMRTMNVKW